MDRLRVRAVKTKCGCRAHERLGRLYVGLARFVLFNNVGVNIQVQTSNRSFLADVRHTCDTPKESTTQP